MVYEFRLENDDLGVCEEVVIKDDNSIRALRDAYTIFINRLLESDEGWKVIVESYDDYDPDLIDVDNLEDK